MPDEVNNDEVNNGYPNSAADTGSLVTGVQCSGAWERKSEGRKLVPTV